MHMIAQPFMQKIFLENCITINSWKFLFSFDRRCRGVEFTTFMSEDIFELLNLWLLPTQIDIYQKLFCKRLR